MPTNTGRKSTTTPAADDGNPLALVAGGIAAGVVLGMLLPRLDKERELLAPVGEKIADRASATIQAATVKIVFCRLVTARAMTGAFLTCRGSCRRRAWRRRQRCWQG